MFKLIHIRHALNNLRSLYLNSIIINLLISQHILVVGPNTIDLIIILPDSAIISKPTQGNLLSDHYIISFDIRVSHFIFSDHVKHYRKISKINLQLFINSVYAYISIHNTSLANYISYDNLNDALRYSLDAHSPLIISTNKYGAHSPWF